MRRRAILVTLISFLTTSALAGPFGLDMGEKTNDLDVGVDLEDGNYTLNSVPRPHPRFANYGVRATTETGICQIKALTEKFENDRYGRKVRDVYGEIREQLEKNYGAGRHYDNLQSGALWDDADEWVMSIAQNERSVSTFWVADSGFKGKDDIRAIYTQIRANSSDVSYIYIQYEMANNAECNKIIEERSAGAL